MSRSTVLRLTLSAILGSAAAAASAADAPPVGGPDAGRLEDIVVTAQRREESAQSVGIALSVLSPEALREAGVGKVNDLSNITPSLEVEPAFSSGQPQFRLRGVGFIDYTSNNTAAVGVTIDEVPQPFPIQTQGQLFDISRVEVLRGPQGTLYGLNTTGGAVNFVINKPTADPHAGISLDYGSFGDFNGEAFVSGPIAETLTGRLSLATEQGGAWQRNRDTNEKLGDKNKIAIRGQLEWSPSSAAKIRLSLHSATDKSEAYGTQLIAPFTIPGGGGATIPADTNPYLTGWSLSPTFAAFAGIDPKTKPGVDNSNNGADLNINVDFSGARLTSISSYDHFVRREFVDWDATQYNESDVYFHDGITVFSQEVRLASTGSGPLGWVAGAFYSDNKLDERFYGDFTQIYGASAITTYRQESKTYGAFGQVNYQFTDRLKGILGLRPNKETRDLIDLDTKFGTTTDSGLSSQSISNSSLSGKAELDFQLDKATLLYGSISRGVKSGGFTAHNFTTQSPPFKPETLLAYEIGAKADVLPTLRINASLFHYDYHNQQVLSKFQTQTGYIGSFINAPTSKIDGGEVELTWAPGGGFELTQYAGYKVGKFTSTVLNSTPADFNGKDIDFPKLSYGGTAAYSWPVGDYRLRLEGNYSYHDKYDQPFLLENVDTNGNVVGAPQFEIKSYWLANASIDLTPADGSWTVSLWAHNITDQQYYLTKNFFLPTNNIGAAGEPSTFGVHVDWRF